MRVAGFVRFVRAAAAAAALVLCAENTGAAIAEGTTLSVRRVADGLYRVEGKFEVAGPRAVAWEVLTDYSNLSSFVSSIDSSVATRETGGRLLVAQQATARVGPFARRLHLVLDVTEEPPQRIAFRDVSGKTFEHYAGTWELLEHGGTVYVRYSLAARPHSSPPLFGRSILGANARGLLDEVRLEVLRRTEAARSGR